MTKKYLLFLICALISTSLFASVDIQVDRDNIASDEVLTLVISSNDRISITPDLSPLKKDFSIVGTSQNSQLTMTNGVTQMETQWQIALLPKHSGDILLPALQVGTETTPTRLIHVQAVKRAITTEKPGNQDIYLEAKVIPQEAYVQEQLVYTLKLYYRKTIENPYLMAPDLAGAKMTQNGQDILYTTVKNGKYYRVLERSYLITPKTTGRLSIQPPVLKGYLDEPTDMINVYGFSAHTLKPVKVIGPTIQITVKPKPTNFTGQWFPAKKVTISEAWEPTPPTFREGEPVSRIIEVTAQGATGDQIPPLSVSSSAQMNSYPETPKKDSSATGDIQIGRLTQKIVYIPTQAGKVTLPPVKLSWWNSATQKAQVSMLPAKTITVLPAYQKAAQNVSSTRQYRPQTRVTPAQMQQADGETHSVNLVTRLKPYIWPFIAFFLVILWLITLWLWRRQLRSHSAGRKRQHITITELEKQLLEACEKGNARQARKVFLEWAINYWKDPAMHALLDVVIKLEAEQAHAFESELMKLEAVFYGKTKRQWDGTAFWEALQAYLRLSQARSQQANLDPLPPLYCSEN